MKLLLVTLRKRAGSDEVSRRETVLEGDQIRIGRGVAMEINLPDIDVDFHHATLTSAGGMLTMMSVSESGLTVNKKGQNQVSMQPGTQVVIGRYTFASEPGRDGADHVLVMEEEPSTLAAGKSRSGSKRRLEEVLPSRRTLAWVFSLIIIGLFAAWPMSDVLTRPAPADGPQVVDGMARTDIPLPTVMEVAWSSGPISKAHQMIEDDCGACHKRPFEMTTNNACLSCHADTRNHANPDDHPAVALESTRCASCHKEHNGGDTPTAVANTACVACHGQIKTVSEKSRLTDINSFAADHPPFQLALIINAAENEQGELVPEIRRTVFDPQNPPTEGSGLRFPHAKHLDPKGVKTGDGTKVLVCNDCHVQQAGGRLMRPINMERDCGGCHVHKLTFDAGGTVRELPHANAAETERILRDYFIASAMAGSITEETAPEPIRRKRRQIAGQADVSEKPVALSGSDRTAAITWATETARQRIDTVFKTQLCGTCHETQQLQTENLAQRWRVKPGFVQHHWMPKAEFNHKPHEAMDCTGCHAATESTRASDVLMPGIKVCQGCHMGEEFAGGASSACVDCHDYHIPTRTPMSPEHAQILIERKLQRQAATQTK